MNLRLSIPLIMLTTLFFCDAASAQFSFRRTVGDASFNSFTPGVTEANVFRNSIISSPSLQDSTVGAGYFTRHAKQSSYTGIGGSSLQTTSITSESRPALIRPTSLSVGTPLIGRPDLNLHLQTSNSNPALRNYTVSGPTLDDEPLFARSTETFTSQPSLVSPYGSRNFSDDF